MALISSKQHGQAFRNIQSHRQIAEQLDISEETVKKHVHNALKVLRPRVELVLLACLLMK
ncbi:hypothetical protein IDJ77_16360 [Mucilaginibacter sp. ZT4R22]|uniref:RNA polymerase sigma-70 region 4 domain-containing protein n=1 Tax=Mucilaginibacter pankratovii TaxID=2772110 RepID=A0ABR7WT70_9SPHI|nr:sigma factor-like helix-turn-helix DNA-binding protein [Mucilaginibacter pankratovii]MBD1365388.1 hypothetical protein [Mucilaginibacter pankratovii]